MSTPLEQEFDKAMLEVYRQAKVHCRYNAMYFLQMVHERGGLQTAKHLLHAPSTSEGFTRLWECGRLDLTVEAVILQPKWHTLFSEEERTIASQRLRELGYRPQVTPD
jgi:hypothetical protein